MPDLSDSTKVISAVVGLTKNLGFKNTAEGVETPPMLRLLLPWGVTPLKASLCQGNASFRIRCQSQAPHRRGAWTPSASAGVTVYFVAIHRAVAHGRFMRHA